MGWRELLSPARFAVEKGIQAGVVVALALFVLQTAVEPLGHRIAGELSADHKHMAGFGGRISDVGTGLALVGTFAATALLVRQWFHWWKEEEGVDHFTASTTLVSPKVVGLFPRGSLRRFVLIEVSSKVGGVVAVAAAVTALSYLLGQYAIRPVGHLLDQAMTSEERHAKHCGPQDIVDGLVLSLVLVTTTGVVVGLAGLFFCTIYESCREYVAVEYKAWHRKAEVVLSRDLDRESGVRRHDE